MPGIEGLSSRLTVEGDAQRIRLRFDAVFGDQLAALYQSIDAALAKERVHESLLESVIHEGSRRRVALGLAVARKCVNDILASVAMLRAGYHEHAAAIFRDAIEHICTASLIVSDFPSFDAFRKGKFRSNQSVDRFSKVFLKGGRPESKRLFQTYNKLHSHAHPPTKALIRKVFFDRSIGTVGGYFDESKLPVYGWHLDNLRLLSQNLALFHQTQVARWRSRP